MYVGMYSFVQKIFVVPIHIFMLYKLLAIVITRYFGNVYGIKVQVKAMVGS